MINNLKVLFIIILLTFFNFSCGNGDIEIYGDFYAPRVKNIAWTIDERANNPGPNFITAYISFLIFLENGNEYIKISSIKIIDPLKKGYWLFESEDLIKRWNEKLKGFEIRNLYSSLHEHSIILGEYTIEINEEGKEPTTSYSTVFGRNDPNLDSGHIYSYYVELTPKILKPPYNYSIFLDENDLTVNFEADDDIIDNGFFWYFNSDDILLGTSPPLKVLGNINNSGSNSFILDISEIDLIIDNIIICLMSSTESGCYRTWSSRIY